MLRPLKTNIYIYIYIYICATPLKTNVFKQICCLYVRVVLDDKANVLNADLFLNVKTLAGSNKSKKSKVLGSMGTLGVVFLFVITMFWSLPVFLQGGVDQKLQKHWQAHQKRIYTTQKAPIDPKNVVSLLCLSLQGFCDYGLLNCFAFFFEVAREFAISRAAKVANSLAGSKNVNI